MKQILITILFAGSIKSFCQSAVTHYKDTVNNFAIDIPAGWKYGVNKQFPDLKLIAVRISTDVYKKAHENFNLNIIEKKNSDIENEYNKLIGALSSTNNFKLLKKDTITIHGQLYKCFIEEHKNDLNAEPMSNYVFITYKNGKTYILTFVTISKSFDKYSALFYNIATTFVL